MHFGWWVAADAAVFIWADIITNGRRRLGQRSHTINYMPCQPIGAEYTGSSTTKSSYLYEAKVGRLTRQRSTYTIRYVINKKCDASATRPVAAGMHLLTSTLWLCGRSQRFSLKTGNVTVYQFSPTRIYSLELINIVVNKWWSKLILLCELADEVVLK